MFYRAIHSAIARIMDGDKQQYNDALIAAQCAQRRGGYNNSDVDNDDQSEQLLIFSSNRDVYVSLKNFCVRTNAI